MNFLWLLMSFCCSCFFLNPGMPKNHDRVNPPLRRGNPPLRRGNPPLRFCSCMSKFILHSWAAAHAWEPLYEQLLMNVIFLAHEQLLMHESLYISSCSWFFFAREYSCSCMSTPTWVAAHEFSYIYIHMSSCSWFFLHMSSCFCMSTPIIYEQLLMNEWPYSYSWINAQIFLMLEYPNLLTDNHRFRIIALVGIYIDRCPWINTAIFFMHEHSKFECPRE